MALQYNKKPGTILFTQDRLGYPRFSVFPDGFQDLFLFSIYMKCRNGILVWKTLNLYSVFN